MAQGERVCANNDRRDGIVGRVDGWADASSNVLPVIERRLKAGGNFGVPLCSQPPLAGTWTRFGPLDAGKHVTRVLDAVLIKQSLARGNICRLDCGFSFHYGANSGQTSVTG